MGIVMKRKSMLSLFSTLVILASVISFSMSANAMTKEGPDLSHLEHVNISATFDTTKDGIQEEIIYDENGEVVGTLKIEEVDTANTTSDDPITIPIGVKVYQIIFEDEEEDSVINTIMYTMVVTNDGEYIRIGDIYDTEIQLRGPFEEAWTERTIPQRTTKVDTTDDPEPAIASWKGQIMETVAGDFITNWDLLSYIHGNSLTVELKLDVAP